MSWYVFRRRGSDWPVTVSGPFQTREEAEARAVEKQAACVPPWEHTVAELNWPSEVEE